MKIKWKIIEDKVNPDNTRTVTIQEVKVKLFGKDEPGEKYTLTLNNKYSTAKFKAKLKRDVLMAREEKAQAKKSKPSTPLKVHDFEEFLNA